MPNSATGTEKSGFPYFEVQFTKKGDVHDDAEAAAVKKHLAASDTKDLLVLAHGWNNDMRDARRLYEGMLSELRRELNARRIRGGPKSITVLAVLWPSKKFADVELTASGAAALGGVVSDAALLSEIDQLEQIFDTAEDRKTLESLRLLVPRLEDSPKAQAEFADTLRSVVSRAATADAEKGEEGGEDDDASDTFFTLPAPELMERLAKPVDLGADTPADRPETDPLDDVGGAARLDEADAGDDAGGAAGLGEFLSGIKSAASNAMNYATFYAMKQRAGAVGQRGLNQLLREIEKSRPDLRINLVGHSFGARLVTAATAGRNEQSGITPHSLVLLQAAFSHNGFAKNFDGKGGNGAFRRVVSAGLVHGPLVVSHTRNDKAVGLAYPLASLISGNDAAGLGDEHDRFGGLGRNGAQFTPEVVRGTLTGVDGSYDFDRGRIYNLRADSVISDHSDIVSPEVAHAIAAAIAA